MPGSGGTTAAGRIVGPWLCDDAARLVDGRVARNDLKAFINAHRHGPGRRSAAAVLHSDGDRKCKRVRKQTLPTGRQQCDR
jgi:hypothetical protein